MNPMKLPELLFEIATHLDSTGDIIRLAQTDRFSHEMVLPFLFRDIDISFAAVSSLAAALRRTATLGNTCRSLVFRRALDELSDKDEDYDDEEEPDDDEPDWTVYAPLYTDLCTIFHALSAHSCLRRISLKWNARRYLGTDVEFPSEVWGAISAASSHLEALEISVGVTEERDWQILMVGTIPNLRVFDLQMAAHGWECAYLQEFLDKHPSIEDLTLELPTCCGPEGITLESTFPALKAFAMNAPRLTVGDSSFLERHPRLERLRLDTVQQFSLNGQGLHNLRAMYITHSIAWCLPAFSFSLTGSLTPITHLRLRSQPDLSHATVAEVVGTVAGTLRCLELDQVDEEAFTVLLVHIRGLMQLAPNLAELAIVAREWPKPPRWDEKNLINLLAAIDDSTLVALRVVHYKSGMPLPPSVLTDLGPVPSSLKYIGWDVPRQPITYAIGRLGDKNIGRAMACSPFPREGEGWTAESVLDHLGPC
ncbi:hypothetical protein B0H17DRAFT_1182067 [Mycena rosella]|uniref:F-box domain-containing protein n=1 Tax=Mycena rosella TaxID=1033263 RepID=A0AAD7GEA8_MYCRO|nr:hypothetical protein B0H17DRAFT_1182067 [Mycena rosella]